MNYALDELSDTSHSIFDLIPPHFGAESVPLKVKCVSKTIFSDLPSKTLSLHSITSLTSYSPCYKGRLQFRLVTIQIGHNSDRSQFRSVTIQIGHNSDRSQFRSVTIQIGHNSDHKSIQI
jgi:hypothetical protein